MAQNGTGFWTDAKHRAAERLAAGKLSDEEIAEELGVGRRTLARWKTVPAFTDRIVEIVRTNAEELRKKGVRERVNRLAELDDVVERIKQVFAARAEDCASVPGGATGLLTRQIKLLGRGDNAREVEEYRVDTGTLRELREYLKQAAIEVGEWAEKRLFGGIDNQTIPVEVELAITKVYGQEDESDEVVNDVNGSEPVKANQKRSRKKRGKIGSSRQAGGRRPKAAS